MILVKVCLFPVLLNVPDTVQPLFVTNETPLVHFLIFGVQFGETSVISLQLFSKENVIAQLTVEFIPCIKVDGIMRKAWGLGFVRCALAVRSGSSVLEVNPEVDEVVRTDHARRGECSFLDGIGDEPVDVI